MPRQSAHRYAYRARRLPGRRPDHSRCGGLVGGGNDERDVVVTDQAGTTTVTTRPSKLGCPFTRWSLRKLTVSADVMRPARTRAEGRRARLVVAAGWSRRRAGGVWPRRIGGRVLIERSVGRCVL
jgi:hypothetical protein